MADTPDRSPFRFSLAWLMFWTLVCAALAGTVRMFLDRGAAGFECLIFFAIFTAWLAVTGLAMWHRVFARHRWKKVDAQRKELANLVRARREDVRRQAEEDKEPRRAE
jgi:hypothetical protein